MINQLLSKTFQYLSKFNWPSALWTLLILVLCLMPSRELPEGEKIPGFDKLVHVGLFGIWAFLFTCRYPVQMLTVLLSGAVLGISIEFLQEWTNWGRSFEWWDFAADLTGIVSGIAVSRYLKTTDWVR